MIIFRYIKGKIRPIEVDEEQTTNEYMNGKIRNKQNKYNQADIEKYDKKTKKIKEQMEEQEILAVSNYAGITHREINETLAFGQPKEKIVYSDINDINIDIGRIDNAISKSIIDENILAYRGDYIIDFNKYKIGDTIYVSGFSSSSFKESIGIKNATKKGAGGTLLEIRVPAGTKALYLGDNFRSVNEYELLIERNINYKLLDVKNVKNNSYGDYKKAIVEIIK